ncbi:hypothetical protein LIER_24474 [Lithospermum erythrorhizon]|uniref:Uncharacterized protein n=1 Tax=Lithospermum erythrorhizon TaxID=34254 RepID=A0AAV3R2Q1_LITER
MEKGNSLKININTGKERELEPLYSPYIEQRIRLGSTTNFVHFKDTNDRITKFTDPQNKKSDGIDKSSTNLENDIGATKIHNIAADKSMEENIIVDNAENSEKDYKGLQNENSIDDDKGKDEKLD